MVAFFSSTSVYESQNWKAEETTMLIHYSDVMISTMTSQVTSLTIVYSTIYSGTDQRKHQISASLAFVRWIHRWPVNSPHKGPVTRKMFPFDDVIKSFGVFSCRGSNCKLTVDPGKPFEMSATVVNPATGRRYDWEWVIVKQVNPSLQIRVESSQEGRKSSEITHSSILFTRSCFFLSRC